MKKNKNFFKIRWQLLLIILPFAIIPLIIVVSFTANRIFLHLEEQSYSFYFSIISQVANNVDFVYEQYGRTLTNILKIPNVEKGLFSPPYKDITEEIRISTMIKGRNAIYKGNRIIEEGLRKTAEEKIDGDIFLYELDRKSLVNKTDYMIHKLNLGLPDPDINKLLNDPLFLKIKNDNSIKFIFGKLKDGTLKGIDAEKKAVMIFPYYYEPPKKAKDTFTKFILIQLFPDFIEKFYKSITHIKYGTLYILDQLDNIIAYNHPSEDDYYEYDEEKKTYILNDDAPFDPIENISFKEYKLLNTDPDILKKKEIKELISKLNPDYISNMYEDTTIFKKYIIKYNNIKYITVLGYSNSSQCKFIYFHPILQIHKPIYNIITIIFFITFGMIFIVIFLSFLISKIFTDPIKKLVTASESISSGNYKTSIDIKNLYGEFVTLGSSFNYMAKTINDYSQNLEEMVKIRTEELAKANQKIKRDLEIAQRIQQAIIPKFFPKVNLIKIYGIYQPMDDLGGDFYDVFMLNDSKIVFLVVDVCGHGVPAALITAMVKVSFFNNSKENLDCSEIISLVNKEICYIIGEYNSYFTAFYGIFDIKNKILEYTNAGHNDIYILKKDKSITTLSSNSPFVGMVKDFKYRSDTIKLLEEDLLILYTDGIPEMRNPQKELYGEERLKDSIIKYSYLPIEKMLKNIVNDVHNFRGTFKISDDITILGIQILRDSIEININLNNIKTKIIENIFEPDHKIYLEFKNELIKTIDYFNEGRYNDSIEILFSIKKHLKRKIEKFVIYYLLACNYYKMQNIKNTLKYLEEAKRLNPNDSDLLNFINILQLQKENS